MGEQSTSTGKTRRRIDTGGGFAARKALAPLQSQQRSRVSFGLGTLPSAGLRGIPARGGTRVTDDSLPPG